MNWLISTYRNLKLNRLTKFLLIFSVATLTIVGVVWACADGDDDSPSLFSPEAFVSKAYTPFFYDSNNWYYGKDVEITDNENRFNNDVLSDWNNYLNHNATLPALKYLLFKASKKGIDSVADYFNGKIGQLKPDSERINPGQADKAKIGAFFNYLRLAKDCETFAVREPYSWYDSVPPLPPAPLNLEATLKSAFKESNDTFIKQRLWFQLVRYYFYNDDTVKVKTGLTNSQAPIVLLFNDYKGRFPQNLVYYRTMGYLAGYYHRKGDFAESNYLYSRCYDYSYDLKIPSKFSFHAQQESDWQATLKLAKNNQEKITLWHMLGMEYDPARAIKEIAALDPKSDKMDLLLSRLINADENVEMGMYADDAARLANRRARSENIKIVETIALENNTAKPYYWNLAAGYLNYMDKHYQKAGSFYKTASGQLPASDKLVIAQYKVLTILLQVDELKHINSQTEAALTGPLNWLANLRDGKQKIKNLRFAPALDSCAHHLAKVYKKQGDWLKANCFNDSVAFYADSNKVQKLVDLLNKPQKSGFEKMMLRYYPRSLNDLYRFQATVLTYKSEIINAIAVTSKIKETAPDLLPANPFNDRLLDCHDCDAAAHQKQKFSATTFLKTLHNMETDLSAGKDSYRNALLLGNAYYNISYYGNARLFYQSNIIGTADASPDYPVPFRAMVTSQANAKKYYLIALKNAQTGDQKAKCIFLAAKCGRNEFYTSYVMANKDSELEDAPKPPAGQYFKELKDDYNNTAYYKEVLHECGYFAKYVNGK